MAAHLPSPATLVTLPFDVLYLIAQDMDFSNFVHLSRTCRAMYTCMRSELIARRIVEVRAEPHRQPLRSAFAPMKTREDFHMPT